MCHLPHFTLLLSAVLSIAGTTREHLSLSTASLEFPVVIVVNRTDLATESQLKATIHDLESFFRSPMVKRKSRQTKVSEDVLTPCVSEAKVVPVFCPSSVPGLQLDLFNVLPPQLSSPDKERLLQVKAEIQGDQSFHVPSLGNVDAGLSLSGCIKCGETIALGPFKDGSFVPFTISSVHRDTVPCNLVRAGESATLALLPSKPSSQIFGNDKCLLIHNNSSVEICRERFKASSTMNSYNKRDWLTQNDKRRDDREQKRKKRRMLNNLLSKYHLPFCHHYTLNMLTIESNFEKEKSHPEEEQQDDQESCHHNLSSVIGQLLALDSMAHRMSCEFDTLVSRYNCQSGFSVKWDCDECRSTYHDWICSMVLPFVSQNKDEGVTIRKPCKSLCERVEQRCPYFQPAHRDQYAGEPAFLCIDPAIPFIPWITPTIPFGDSSQCYDICDFDSNLDSSRCISSSKCRSRKAEDEKADLFTSMSADGPVLNVTSLELDSQKINQADSQSVHTETNAGVEKELHVAYYHRSHLVLPKRNPITSSKSNNDQKRTNPPSPSTLSSLHQDTITLLTNDATTSTTSTNSPSSSSTHLHSTSSLPLTSLSQGGQGAADTLTHSSPSQQIPGPTTSEPVPGPASLSLPCSSSSSSSETDSRLCSTISPNEQMKELIDEDNSAPAAPVTKDGNNDALIGNVRKLLLKPQVEIVAPKEVKGGYNVPSQVKNGHSLERNNDDNDDTEDSDVDQDVLDSGSLTTDDPHVRRRDQPSASPAAQLSSRPSSKSMPQQATAISTPSKLDGFHQDASSDEKS